MPGKARLYVPPEPIQELSGVTLHYKAKDTWACDECWDHFLTELSKAWGGKTEVFTR